MRPDRILPGANHTLQNSGYCPIAEVTQRSRMGLTQNPPPAVPLSLEPADGRLGHEFRIRAACIRSGRMANGLRRPLTRMKLAEIASFIWFNHPPTVATGERKVGEARLGLPDPEHLCSARRTHASCRRAAVSHGYLGRVAHLPHILHFMQDAPGYPAAALTDSASVSRAAP